MRKLLGGGAAGSAAILVLMLASCATAGGGSNRAFSSSFISASDLEALPEMTLYELLRQHSRIRIQNPGGGEHVYVEDRTQWGVGPASRWRPCLVYLNDRRALDGLATLRDLRTTDVSRIEILTSPEASARFGGDGRDPVIAIRTRGDASG